jgi:hypothetical protein
MKLFNRIFSDPFAWFASFWLVLLSLLTVCEITKAQSPFTPKATLPATAPQLQRAVIVFAPGERASMPNQDTGYHVFVGDQGYHAAGMGPKTAGIYDVEVYPSKDGKIPGLIVVHKENPGGAVHGKPLDETFRLQIITPYNDEPVPAQLTNTIVDGRRLIIYDRVSDRGGNMIYRAVAIDHQTGRETYFLASGYTPDLTPGIYDFKTDKVGAQDYLDVLTYSKDPNTKGYIEWLRLGVGASCEACDPVDPMFAKQNYR